MGHRYDDPYDNLQYDLQRKYQSPALLALCKGNSEMTGGFLSQPSGQFSYRGPKCHWGKS